MDRPLSETETAARRTHPTPLPLKTLSITVCPVSGPEAHRIMRTLDSAFFRACFWRLGFLDGWPGYFIAGMNAFSTVTRHANVLEARLPANRRAADGPGGTPNP